MRHRAIGVVLVLHGLAHAAAGMWAASEGPAWFVTPVWWAATTGLAAAGCGALGIAPLARWWRPLAVVGIAASVLLLVPFGAPVGGIGLVVDVLLVATLGRLDAGAPARDHASVARHPRAHAVARLGVLLALVWLSAVVLLRPWHRDWGTSAEERVLPLPGDELVPDARYRMDHAITIAAPADSVWPWLVQLGQDRGGFYSYDWLERAVGDDVRNADRIHAEWQRIARGDLVRATQPDYLGGIFGPDLGWRVVRVDSGRALVLAQWGAFVVRPLDARTSRLHVRLRGEGARSVTSVLLAPFGLLVFEPAHFIMERAMLRGIRARAEGMMRRA